MGYRASECVSLERGDAADEVGQPDDGTVWISTMWAGRSCKLLSLSCPVRRYNVAGDTAYEAGDRGGDVAGSLR